MTLDRRHVATIKRVLNAIAEGEDNPARGLVALEDVAVALQMGIRAGLTARQVAESAGAGIDDLIAEESTERPH